LLRTKPQEIMKTNTEILSRLSHVNKSIDALEESGGRNEEVKRLYQSRKELLWVLNKD
jgi:hypothetical protein